MLARMPAPRLESPRLILREFTAADVAPYAATIADPEVMRFMGSGWRYRLKRGIAGLLGSVSHAEARLDLRRIRRHWERHGWGEWAVEERTGNELVGRVGFKHHPDFTADPSGSRSDGCSRGGSGAGGYATEAAQLALGEGFERLGLDRVISISSPSNERSVGVMRALGMTEAGRTRGTGSTWSGPLSIARIGRPQPAPEAPKRADRVELRRPAELGPRPGGVDHDRVARHLHESRMQASGPSRDRRQPAAQPVRQANVAHSKHPRHVGRARCPGRPR